MPNVRLYQRSFAGGEISPEMFGRIDDVKYQTGAATMKNFVALPQGPAENRAGTRFVRETKAGNRKSRLIPFTYSTDQTLALELGVNSANTTGYIRFHTQGGTLLPSGMVDYQPAPASCTFSGSTVSAANEFKSGSKMFFTTTGTLPSPLVAGKVYTIPTGGIPTALDFTIAEVATPSVVISFTGSGTGNHTVHWQYDQGSATSKNGPFNTSATTDTTTVTWETHGFQNNTRVFFTSLTVSGGGTSSISLNTPYYVVNRTATTFQIATAANGASVPICTSGTATAAIYRYFEQGDLVNYKVSVTGGGVPFVVDMVAYYRNLTVSAYNNPGASTGTSPAPISNQYWWSQPSTGEYEIPTQDFNAPEIYKEEDLFSIHYAQSNDVLTLVHPKYQPTELRRLGATKWVIKPITFGTSIAIPSGVTAVASQGSVNQISNLSVASNTTPCTFTTVGSHNFLAGDPVYVSGLKSGASIYVSGIPTGEGFYVVAEAASATTFRLKEYTDGASIIRDTTSTAYPSGNPGRVTYWAKISDPKQYYVVTAVGPTFEESQASAEANCTNNLFVSGAYNTITWSAVAGAVRYNVYKKQSGLFGYIGQTTALTFTDDNIAPDMGTTPPIYDTTLVTPGAETGTYPGAVTYYEQRRCFAGTTNLPQNVWMTRSGTESDLSYGIPVQDSDRISFRIAAREANTIRHMVPLQQLVLLTNSAEWRVTSVNNDALTPFSISVRPQSYIGANNVQPSIINNSLVYCAARGGHVREMGYSWQSNGYITGDLSLRAAHLFDDLELLDMTYSKSPMPILWFISSNGKLLGMTYIPEEQLGAWHQHETDGYFESCTSIPEGDEDSLYVIVRRDINGQTKRYVERMETRNFTSLADAWFVDSGLTTTTVAPITTLSGLSHLNDKFVSILVDGQPLPQKKVIGGSVALGVTVPAGKKVIVGLPFTAELQTVPATFQSEAFGKGAFKNVNKVVVGTYKSCDFYVGPSVSQLVESNVYSSTAAFTNGEVDVLIQPKWDWTGQVTIRMTDPLPLNVVSVCFETSIGGS